MAWIGSASRILIFSIAVSANYSCEVKNIEIWAPTFFKHNNSSVAPVCGQTKFNRGAVVRLCLWGNQDPLPKHFKLTLTSMYTKSQNILIVLNEGNNATVTQRDWRFYSSFSI